MKTRIILFFLLCLNSIIIHAQFTELRCETDISSRSALPPAVNNEYGMGFTPKGTMNALIVYVVFKNSLVINADGWEMSELPASPNQINISSAKRNGFPTYFEEGTLDPKEFFFDEASDFTDPLQIGDPIVQKQNFSYLFNKMSKPKEDFRLVCKTFEREDGNGGFIKTPILIDRDETGDITSWYQLNKKVYEKMNALNSDPTWWSQFDQRKNSPEFKTDNSANGNPDGYIDFIIYVYRYLPSDPEYTNNTTMSNWLGSGGGYSTIESYDFGGKKTRETLLIAQGTGKPTSLVIHEVAHSMFDAPHICGANGISGKHFYIPSTGIGTTTTSNMSGNMFNPWERWYLDYIDPYSVTSDATLSINDYSESGDAIKINIPGTNQRLWLMGMFKNHPMNDHIWYGKDIGPGSILFPNSAKGIYAMIENITGNSAIGTVFNSGANGIKFINAAGNFGYRWDPSIPTVTNNWNNVIKGVNYNESEPIGGVSIWNHLRDNISGGSVIDNSENANSPNPKNELVAFLTEKDGSSYPLKYRNWGGDDNPSWSRSSAFQSGDEMNIGTNPTVTNIQTYDQSTGILSPIVLNGLRIKINNIDYITGSASITIEFNKVIVNNDVNWTGNIDLPNITQDGSADLVINNGKKININLSKTVNSHKINTSTVDYINPSIFTLKSGSKTIINPSGELNIINKSTLIVDAGSEIIVKNGAKLLIDQNSFIHLKGGVINIENGGKLIIKGKIITDSGINFEPQGEGITEIHSTHQLALGTNSKVIFSRSNGSSISPMFSIKDNTNFLIQSRNLEINNCSGIIGNNAKINVDAGKVSLFKAKLYSSSSNPVNNIGIENTNSTGFIASQVEFTEINQAVKINGPSSLVVNLLLIDMNNCRLGIEVNGIRRLDIKDSDLYGCSIYAIKGISIGEIYTNNSIISNTNSGDGFYVEDVPFCHLIKTEIKNAYTGVKVARSNLFVKKCSNIHHNNIGIDYINNTTMNYSLTVGDYFPAAISYNTYANVRGKNVVLNIDATIHTYNRPLPYNKVILPNDFSNSALIFDICYDNLLTAAAIPMKGNYWGGNPLSSYAFNIKKNVLCNTNVSVDASQHSVNYYQNCGPIDADPGEPGGIGDQNKLEPEYVNCNILNGIDTIYVHDQNKLGAEKILDSNYVEAINKFEPISEMEVTENDNCEMMKYYAHTITHANQELDSRYKKDWDASVIRYGKVNELISQSQQVILINDLENILLKNLDKSFNNIKVFSANGQLINSFYTNSDEYIFDKKSLSPGIYFVNIRNKNKIYQTLKFIIY